MVRWTVLLAACVAIPIACASRKTEPSVASDPEVARLRAVVEAGGGSAKRGQAVFAARCGACHKLHDVGADVGPNLTPYLRDKEHLDFILASVVRPNALIHEYHPTILVTTRDGKTYTGTVVDESTHSLRLVMPGGGHVDLSQSEVVSITERGGSLMPTQTLAGLSDEQVRDLFAFIRRP